MQIRLTPMRSDARLTLHRAGDVLTVNDVVLDFSAIPEGAVLPRAAVACDALASDVCREGGRLHLTLILPHGADAPQACLHPAPLLLLADGPVPLPGVEAGA